MRLRFFLRRLRSLLREAWARPHQPPYDADYPLVVCTCGEEYTACNLGNHYCPSCGDSCDEAVDAGCVHCVCVEQTVDAPCCYCGATPE